MESLFQNCFFVDNPRFRHDLGVSYQHLCEHLVNTVLVTLRNVKKSLAKQRVAPQGGVEVKNISSVQELMRFEAFFQPEDREGVQCIEHIEKGLLRCNSAGGIDSSRTPHALSPDDQRAALNHIAPFRNQRHCVRLR